MSAPIRAVPTMLPIAPTPRASAIEARPTSTVTAILARITRPRCGTRVNVVRPARWLHSPVTDRIASTGSRIVIGTPMAPAKLS